MSDEEEDLDSINRGHAESDQEEFARLSREYTDAINSGSLDEEELNILWSEVLTAEAKANCSF